MTSPHLLQVFSCHRKAIRLAPQVAHPLLLTPAACYRAGAPVAPIGDHTPRHRKRRHAGRPDHLKSSRFSQPAVSVSGAWHASPSPWA